MADLQRALAFYTAKAGFFARSDGAGRAALSVEENAPPLLFLQEDAGAARPPPDAAGLFHAALLFPGREGLGRWLRTAVAAGVAFDGFADHGVSEALYFHDPEGNGLEFYADRPRESWPRDADGVAMFTEPLDVDGLLAAGDSGAGPRLKGASWGHLHLRVSDLGRSGKFYRDKLGLEDTQRSFPGALFLAADGYHHHLGLNTWGGVRRPQPPNALGLASATFGGTGAVSISNTDPDGIRIQAEM